MQYDYLVHAAGGVTSYFGMESIPFEVRAFNRLAPDTSKSWVRAAKALL